MIHSWETFKSELKRWCENETNLIGQTFSYVYLPEKETITVTLRMPDTFTAKRIISKDGYYRISNKDISDSIICSTIIQNLKRKYKDQDHIGYRP